MLNPIIDWSDSDVWEFIHEYNVPYCELYDKGHKRLGCIGCPMGRGQNAELKKYPKYYNAYMKAFERMLENNKKKGIDRGWKTAKDVMKWWLGEESEGE